MFAAFRTRLFRNQTKRILRRAMIEMLERRDVFNTTPFVLSTGNFSQDWSFLGGDQLTTNDDWSAVPSIMGYRGDGLTAATGADPQTVLNDGTLVVDVNVNQTAPNTNTTGGVTEFALTNPVVAFQGSGTAGAPNLVLFLDATGRGSITINYNLRDIDGSADNSVQPVALQYRVGSTGNYINIPAAFVADASSGPNAATQVTAVSAVLPVAADNQSLVQVRIITNNAVGNDEWIGVDDIVVSSSVYVPPSNPNFTIQTAANNNLKAEGNTGTTAYTFTVTRDANTTVAASVDWAVSGAVVGTATAADASDFAAPTSGTVNFAAGEISKDITILVNGDTTVEPDEGLQVTLSNALPSGATIGAGQGAANAIIANDDAVQSLVAGDVVITAISTVPNPDVFTFVPLVDLLPGMTVYFTDNGWTATGTAGGLGTAEGTVAFVVGASGLAKGTKVEIDLSLDQLTASIVPSSAGVATVSGTFALNSTGDSLIAYTTSPLLPNPLFAINTGSTYTPTTFSNSVTFLPAGLAIGQSAVDALGAPASTIPQSQYDHTPYFGSAAVLAAAVADKNNWVNDLSATTRIVINSSNLIVGPAVIVTPATGLITTETGATATFTVVLSTQPTADVTINLSSSDTTEGTVLPTAMTFTSANWNTPQTVTITGVDDVDIDGNIAYSIVTSTAVSTDSDYNNRAVDDVAVINNDNDVPGVTVTPTTGLVTTEAGGTTTFTVVLASQPSANVTIALTSDKPGEGTAGPASLVFTSSNWNVPQTVTVTGVDDALIDGNVAYNIVTAATSSDTNYNNIAVADVAVLNIDNDRNTSALLNEIVANPAGTDEPYEYVELIGTPNSGLIGYYFVHFEGDSGTTQGAADLVVDLSTFSFGANGLLVIKAPTGGFTMPSATTVVSVNAFTTGALENGTTAFMLIYSPQNPIVQAVDYDAAVGTLSLPSGAIIQDTIGWSDGGAGDIVYGGVTLVQSSGTPDAASRIVGNATASSLSSWYNGDILDTTSSTSLGYDPARASANLPSGAALTPGDTNFAASNQPPVVAADAASVSGNEGTTITNTGTWSDPNASDVVTLTASVGTVIKNANGTWSWSIATTDNQAATNVTITAADGNGGSATATFAYTVNNVGPTVAANSATVSGNVLSTISNTGTYADVAADTVTLSASVGTIVNNGNGAWSWSITPTAAITNQIVTITAADEDGGSNTTTFTYTALVVVSNRQLFYNNSGFESVGGVIASLDSSKSLLASSATTQTTTFANVSSYTRGINGAVLDVAGLASTALTAADFIFRVAPAGASGVVNPSTWANAPTPSALVVTAGTTTEPARVQLEWTDNQIQNTWLQIVVRANANTGLATPAVFYLGHAQAEVNGVGPYRVSVADLSPVQTAVSTNLVGVNDLRDLNKDRRVTVADLSFVQVRISTAVNLSNITVPVAGSTEEGASAGGGGGGGSGNALFLQGAPAAVSQIDRNAQSSVSAAQPIVQDLALSAFVSGPVQTTRTPTGRSMDLIRPLKTRPSSQETADAFFAKLGNQLGS